MLLYIHIPYCISKCSYCDFFSRPCGSSQYVPDSYIEALCREISFRLSFYKIKKLETIYIGGGTPSLISAGQFTKLFSEIRKNTEVDENTEITVELNPDDVSISLLESLSACGVNRISCGIQSMNDRALKYAGRRADAVTNAKALSLFSRFWKGDLSIDLISGLPEDDENSLISSLKEVCDVNPCHISLYSLTIEEETPFGKQLAEGKLNYDFEEADRLWLIGRDFLEKKGYQWYEVSNFCKSGRECKHNLGYWNHKDYTGCGSGACGTIYSKNGAGFRWTGTYDLEKYIDFWNSQAVEKNLEINKADLPQINEEIDISKSEFEFFMMGLRKLNGISSLEYKEIFGKALPDHFIKLFNDWEKKGLCEIKSADKTEREKRYCLSRQGILFLNRFLEELI